MTSSTAACSSRSIWGRVFGWCCQRVVGRGGEGWVVCVCSGAAGGARHSATRSHMPPPQTHHHPSACSTPHLLQHDVGVDDEVLARAGGELVRGRVAPRVQGGPRPDVVAQVVLAHDLGGGGWGGVGVDGWVGGGRRLAGQPPASSDSSPSMHACEPSGSRSARAATPPPRFTPSGGLAHLEHAALLGLLRVRLVLQHPGWLLAWSRSAG